MNKNLLLKTLVNHYNCSVELLKHWLFLDWHDDQPTINNMAMSTSQNLLKKSSLIYVNIVPCLYLEDNFVFLQLFYITL